MKYVKVMFSTKSRYNNYQYKLGEVNNAPSWNPNGKTPEEMGGLNFANEESILRYLHNGDTIYDVELPIDAEVITVTNCATPNCVFRANKIIINNPRKVTDDMALDFYKKTNIPNEAYPKALGGVSLMNFSKTANRIIDDKVNANNIDYFIKEWTDFMDRKERKNCNNTVIEVEKRLKELKNKLHN